MYPLYLLINEAKLRSPMVLHSYLAVDFVFVPVTMYLFSQKYLVDADTLLADL